MIIMIREGFKKSKWKFKMAFAIRGPTPPPPPPQWAKSEGEAVLLQFSGFTKDPMHDFNRLFC